MYEERFMQRAIEISRRALSEAGTEPFGAVVVRDGAIVGEGLNHSKAHFDPTSHGETEAIRDAGRRLECVDLSDCELYSSCEPCALCIAAMHIAGIRRLYYAASSGGAGQAMAGLTTAMRHPIDVASLRADCAVPADAGSMLVSRHREAEAVEVIAAWTAMKMGE